MALSAKGEVAFINIGYFHFVHPLVPRGHPITLGNSKRNRISGQSCFFGNNDEYFAYCGAQCSEIAVAMREPGGIWKEHTSVQLESVTLFRTRQATLMFMTQAPMAKAHKVVEMQACNDTKKYIEGEGIK
jgi:hypothetical protein